MSPQSTLIFIGTFTINFSLAAVWMLEKTFQPYFLKYKKYIPLFVSSIFMAGWFFIFLVYKFPISGDVVNFFIPQGKQALNGFIPNRDFTSSYMPLFPYVMGFVYSLFADSRVIGLFFTLCLCGFSFLFYRIAYVSETQNGPMLFMIGLLNSVVLLLGIGYQQDEIYILFLTGFLFLAIEYDKPLLAGIIGGSVLLLTKLTAIIYLFPFFLLVKKNKISLIGACLAALPILGLFLYLGFSPITMINGETSAAVPPSLINDFRLVSPLYLFFKSHPYFTYSLSGLILCVIGAFVIHRQIKYNIVNLLNLIVLVWLIFLILSLKSLTSYRLLVMPFLPFILDLHRSKWKSIPFIFAVYCSFISVYYMLFEDWNKITRTYYSFSMVPQDQIPQWIILTIIELSIVVFEVAWIFLTAKFLNDNNRLKYAEA